MSGAKVIHLLLSVVVLLPQQFGDAIYIESWKKGKQRVQERKLEVKLSVSNPKYELNVKDASGRVRYMLLVFPAGVDKQTGGIAALSVQLVKPQKFVDSLLPKARADYLKPSNDPYQDYFTQEDFVGSLWPACDERIMGKDIKPGVAPPPFLSKRVVKVDSFYVMFQVRDYKFVGDKKGILESLTLDVEFTNEYAGKRKGGI